MSNRKVGINLVAVKKENRKSILKLVYQNKQISRKDVAKELGLTPAAITLITTDLIEEGLLMESDEQAAPSNKKGRKAIFLQLNACKYASIGVSISKDAFQLVCIDLKNNILFEKTVDTKMHKHSSSHILTNIANSIAQCLEENNTRNTHKIIGCCVSVHGIVDVHSGISVDTYQTWEKNVHVTKILTPLLNMPVFLINNICALAHGENLLSTSKHQNNMLFIKYGPGVGATNFAEDDSDSVFDYRAIQLGHVIVDPEGAPCFCGNQGCLETIVSYSSIVHSVGWLISEKSSPKLHELTNGDSRRLTMEIIVNAYDAEDQLATRAMNRTAYNLALSIYNATKLFDPEIVVLYGELLENAKFAAAIKNELSTYTKTDKVVFSRYNLNLETFGPAATMISYFFENGGFL